MRESLGQSVYFESIGRNILNPVNYPDAVKSYLRNEEEAVKAMLKNFAGLIEIGCFDATYALLCDALSKYYIGVDIVPEYIEEANHNMNFWGLDHERFEALELDAHNISKIRTKSRIYNNLKMEDWLILFPFNCLGNLPYPELVIHGLKQLDASVFISSFQVSEQSTAARKEYYNNCQLQNVKLKSDVDGVRFISSDRFSSVAYNHAWLEKKLEGLQSNTYFFTIGDIGFAAISTKLTVEDTGLLLSGKQSEKGIVERHDLLGANYRSEHTKKMRELKMEIEDLRCQVTQLEAKISAIKYHKD